MPALADLNQKYLSRFKDKLSVSEEFRGETTWTIEKSCLLELMTALKEKEQFDYLVDMLSIDNFGEDPRFEMVYELFSYERELHLRVKCTVGEEEKVPTVSHLWRTADWNEREVYDMMGISFEGHPDLRRILMWEGYPFYPLRKDFPLEGKPSEMPDIAFTRKAPLEGGPFVTSKESNAIHREPRSKSA